MYHGRARGSTAAEALTPSRWDPALQALATRPFVPEDTDAEDDDGLSPCRIDRWARARRACRCPARAVGAAGSASRAGIANALGRSRPQGIWSGETLTPLQRPARFKSKAVLTPEEAAKVAAESWHAPAAKIDRLVEPSRTLQAPTTKSLFNGEPNCPTAARP